MFDRKNNSGVSPVIGIILMVAVTVGLVALASTIVFDLGNNVNEPADVSGSVSFDENSNNITAEVIRNENADSVSVRVPATGSGTVSAVVANGIGSTGTFSFQPNASKSFNDNGPSGGSLFNTGDAAETGTAELVANVGETDNQQVIDTIEYDAS
jgi:flagellin-like protein